MHASSSCDPSKQSLLVCAAIVFSVKVNLDRSVLSQMERLQNDHDELSRKHAEVIANEAKWLTDSAQLKKLHREQRASQVRALLLFLLHLLLYHSVH